MSSDAISDSLKTTPLHSFHSELGAKLVPFAGYEMPVQYPMGIMKEHLHTRAGAGLFDVSHMGQVVVSGAGVAQALEKLVPVELAALPVNKQTYALFTNDQGGIRDDLMIVRWAEDTFFLVVNAACKEQDLAYLREHMQGFQIDYLEGRGLIALQGPAAKDVMAELAPAVNELVFMEGCRVAIEGADCYITRSGYTGEDGFEISVPAEHCEAVARKLLNFEQVEPVGLGARDSLRLEAGLCLYGHDLDVTTTPVEASLLWSISKSRRPGGDKAGGFPGADVIFKQIENGADRKRVGLAIEGKAPVREGAQLVDATGNQVGVVTSGGFGPSAGSPIAMGYVSSDFAAAGTAMNALVRGKPRPVTVCKMPFVAQRYKR
ncbi:MAG: glycine cleavage system aminomethyltransferase GcvT [Porticoccaceae bacterium]|nr:glycine cleavage system aminomethyltransferase GcvT [Pseudomonadales bacterium]MCP5170858.1 glycine cleavage system aminomethyltransferase GcvT [Pseudomonadales bacterium]MCP5301902.1 glycine cleavage system aminomethyltransferase GcvT [Pseudomonadales bacterium]